MVTQTNEMTTKEKEALSYFFKLVRKLIHNDKTMKFVENGEEMKGVRKAYSPFNIKNLPFGYIYAHVYNPKYKDDPKVLPFYDNFPLYIPIGINKFGNLLAFNLHFLKPNHRNGFLKGYVEHLRKAAIDAKGQKILTKKEGKVKWREVSSKTIEKNGGDYLKGSISGAFPEVLKVCIRSYIPSHISSQIYQLDLYELEDNLQFLNKIYKPVFMRKKAEDIYKAIEEQYQAAVHSEDAWSIKEK